MGRDLPVLYLHLLLAIYYVTPIHARFTTTTCWTGVVTACIQQNEYGAWCYIPNVGVCPGTGLYTDPNFATVLEAHIAQGLSVAYYNGNDNFLLGGADYPIPTNPGVIRLCGSGRSGDGNFQTLCPNALADNTFGGSSYCAVLRGQRNVTDGRYAPDVVVHKPSSIISAPSSLSTSASGFPNSGPTHTPDHSSSVQSLKPMFHSILQLWVPVSGRAKMFGLFLSPVVASSWVPATRALSPNALYRGSDDMQQKTGSICYLLNSAVAQVGCSGYVHALLDTVQVFGGGVHDQVMSSHKNDADEYDTQKVVFDNRPSNVSMPTDARHRLSWLKAKLQEVSTLWVPIISVILPFTKRRLFALRFLPIIASSWLPTTRARFTRTTCWGEGDQCIQKNSVGTWCYAPNSASVRTTSCTGVNPANADMASVMEVHLTQGLSIAFYDGVDNGFLGGADFSIPANPGVLYLCMSGQSGDGQLKSVCVDAFVDNAILDNHLSPYCEVGRGQQNVTDGCYNPSRVVKSPTSTVTTVAGATVTVTDASGVVHTPVSTVHTSHALSLGSGLSWHSGLLSFLPILINFYFYNPCQ